ncbi:glycosyltransferase [Thiocapsa marina]|uniref:Glycosyl transferase family 2 n=1 Tax=Thiocapsa marina 5811 TaxID=768671 RepID=F9U9F0_9GAMM|nr:glycosyltransferase [Thiocapsa marina]EGV19408.1 glycosyl transferase family 2 [Thiocapsa marina 5811]
MKNLPGAFFPTSSEDLAGRGPVLVVAAEPGDEIFGCGGTCRRHAVAGDTVVVLVITDGCRDLADPSARAEVRGRLEAQSRKASRVLESREPIFWGEASSAIEYGEKMIQRLVQVATEAGAKLIYAPSVQDPDPTRSVIGLIAHEAVRRLPVDSALVGYEIDVPLQPNLLSDITAVFDLKLAAAACFSSQPHEQLRSDQVAALNRLRAFKLPAQAKAAEGLMVSRGEDLSRPVPGTSSRMKTWAESPSDQPLVSVVIRSAHRPELADALDSIAAQTYRHIEVVLVDVAGNGMLDAEPWCGQFPVRTASSGAPLGRGAAANLGVTSAIGQYVVFLDDDDWFLPDHVSCLVTALSRSDTARAAYAGVECRKRSENGDWEVIHVFNERHDATRLLVENYLPIHAVLFERSLFDDDIRFDDNLALYEDWDFWVKLSRRTNFLHVDRITTVYRISEGSGFGVRAPTPETRVGLEAFFDLWRRRWNLTEVIAIAGYTKHQVAAAKAESQRQCDALREDLRKLRAQHKKDAEREQALERMQATLAAREARISFLETTTDGRIASLDKLTTALAACQARIAKLESESIEKSLQIDQLEYASSNHETRSLELESSLGESISEMHALRSALSAEREQVAALEQIAAAHEQKNCSLERDLSSALELAQASANQRDQLAERLNTIYSSAFWPWAAKLLLLERDQRTLPRTMTTAMKIAWWSATFTLPSALRRRSHARQINASGLFDEFWYTQRYPEVLLGGYRPILHWLSIGWQEHRDPHPLFDTAWYLAHCPEAAESPINPLIHYLQVGANTGIDPHPFFDTAWYLENNPDIAAMGVNPLAHYIATGAREGRSPHPLFDAAWYLENNPDVAAAGKNPLIHFVEQGAREGRDPHPLFRLDWYLENNPALRGSDINPLRHFLVDGTKTNEGPHALFDGPWYAAVNPTVASSGLHPFIHYVTQGWTEHLAPHPLFDSTWYLEHSADVRDAGIDPLRHYIVAGASEGRDPCPLFDTDWYREHNADICGANPLYHYLSAGADEGRDPHPFFNTSWYLENYPDVSESGRNPLVDFLLFGAERGCSPGPGFDSAWYRSRYPDTQAINPLIHYLIAGASEGRLPLNPEHSGAKGRPELKPGAFGKGDPNQTAGRASCDWDGDWRSLFPEPETVPTRLLVIDWKPPTPDRDSGSYRMQMILELLLEAGHAVDFIADRPAEDPGYARSLEVKGIGIIIGQQAALEHLRTKGGTYRSAWISRPELAEVYLPIVRAFAVAARVIYDTVDLHWIRFLRGASFEADPDRLVSLAEHYRRIELSNAIGADLTVAITEDEKHALLEQSPRLEVAVVPNVHRVCPTVAPPSSRRDLFFIGGFQHTPNVDAVLYFVQRILPLVHARQRDIRFNIVGSDMPDVIRALESSLINPVGYVPDVAAWFDQSRVFVAPLRHGAGMKGKIGQSLSYGLPVVTSRIGAEGMGLTHEVNAMICDDPEDFAAAILRLYRDDTFWESLSAAGCGLIKRHFSKEAVAKKLLPLFE